VSTAIDELIIALNDGEDIYCSKPNERTFSYPQANEEAGEVSVCMREPRGDVGGCGRFVCPAAEALSHLLASGTVPVQGQRVLELGGGIGLCGMVAAAMGAKEVLVTDYQQDCLDAAVENAASNGLADTVRASTLDWSSFQGEEATAAAAWERAASAVSVGWTPEVILAADVCYSGEHAVMMMQTAVHIWRHVAPQATLWIVNGFPNRGLRRFEAVIGAQGLFLEHAISVDDPTTRHFAQWHDEEDRAEAERMAGADSAALGVEHQDCIEIRVTRELVDLATKTFVVNGDSRTSEEVQQAGVKQRAYCLQWKPK
jgi:protein-lysine N-methyltransferase EEF2KMT